MRPWQWVILVGTLVVMLLVLGCDDRYHQIPPQSRDPIVNIGGNVYRVHDTEKRVTCYTDRGIYCYLDEELDDALRVRLPTR